LYFLIFYSIMAESPDVNEEDRKKEFLVIRNTIPKSTITVIVSNYFKKFINKYSINNDSKVYATFGEELDESSHRPKSPSNQINTEQTMTITSDSTDSIPRKDINRVQVVPKLSQDVFPSSSSTKHNIIIVDGSIVYRKILHKLFSDHGFNVVELNDGSEVVDLIARLIANVPAYRIESQTSSVGYTTQTTSPGTLRRSYVVEKKDFQVRRQLSLTSGGLNAFPKRVSFDLSPRSPHTATSATTSIMKGEERMPKGSDDCEIYNTSPARTTPRLLQYALTHPHTTTASPGSGNPSRLSSSLVVEDSIVDSIAPQVLLQLRKHRINMIEFVVQREETIHHINNESFNEVYLQQAKSPPPPIIASEKHVSEINTFIGTNAFVRASLTSSSSENNAPPLPSAFLPGTGPTRLSREMAYNSPRVMHSIVQQLTASCHAPSNNMPIPTSCPPPLSSPTSCSAREAHRPAGASHSGKSSPKADTSSTPPPSLGLNTFSPPPPRRTRPIKNSLVDGSSLLYEASMASALHITKAYDVITCAQQQWQQIDLILIDYVMLVQNGPEAVQCIRNMGYNGLIIGLTAKALSNDINIFLTHGADAVFSKPLNWNLFMETFRILHRTQAQAQKQGKEQERPSPSPSPIQDPPAQPQQSLEERVNTGSGKKGKNKDKDRDKESTSGSSGNSDA
jgi:CheY-like chemotaxis protein